MVPISGCGGFAVGNKANRGGVVREILMLAMQILVLAMLWALVVVMAQMVGRVGMAQKVGMVGMVGMVGRVRMAARKSGCYLTTERELLHRGSYLQYLRLGIYLFFGSQR